MSKSLSSVKTIRNIPSKRTLRKILLQNSFKDVSAEYPTFFEGGKKAAVLIPLFFKNGQVQVLLTQRAAHLKTSPGGVAFPGGNRDVDDVDDIETALRESEEEIGLKKDEVEVVSRLPPLISPHDKLFITPVIGFIPDDFIDRACPNPDEVELIFSLPLESYLSEKNHQGLLTLWPGIFYYVHCFSYELSSLPVTYGVTSYICIYVASIVYQRNPDFKMEVTFDRKDASKPFVLAILLYKLDNVANYGETFMKGIKKNIMQNTLPLKSKL